MKQRWTALIFDGFTWTNLGSIFKFLKLLGVLWQEWRCGVCSLNFGLQLEHFHLNCFECFFVELKSILPIVCSGEAVYWRHQLQSNISLWNDWCYSSSHKVDRPFLVFCHLDCLHCLCWNLVAGVRVCLTTVVVIVVGGTNCVVLALVFLSFELTTLISIVAWLFAVVTIFLGYLRFGFLACCVTVIIWSSSGDSVPATSNAILSCETICSYVPFSKCTWISNFFKWGGILATMNCSRIAWASTPNAYFASFCSYF